MWKNIFALISILLYTYGVFFNNMTANKWLLFNYIVQLLGLIYVFFCKRCYPQNILLLLVALAVFIGYKIDLETGPKWGFIDGFTVGIWIFILLKP